MQKGLQSGTARRSGNCLDTGAFFGIYLGRGRPSRSQVFTLELFRVGDNMARNPKSKPMVVDRREQRWAVTDLLDGIWRFGIDVGSVDLSRLTR